MKIVSEKGIIYSKQISKIDPTKLKMFYEKIAKPQNAAISLLNKRDWRAQNVRTEPGFHPWSDDYPTEIAVRDAGPDAAPIVQLERTQILAVVIYLHRHFLPRPDRGPDLWHMLKSQGGIGERVGGDAPAHAARFALGSVGRRRSARPARTRDTRLRVPHRRR